MDKRVAILTADRERKNDYWVLAYSKGDPLSKNIIVLWKGKFRSAFKSRDGKGYIVEIPNWFGTYEYEFMPVLGVQDFYMRKKKFIKINYVSTGGHGPAIPSNLRKALAEEELLTKILNDEGFEAYHIYKSGWGLANPPPPQKYVKGGEIHTKSRFDIEIHDDNGQARKLIDVVGVEPNFRKKPAYRITNFDPKILDERRRAKIYVAWSLNYSLAVYTIVKIIKIHNQALYDTEYREEELNKMWNKNVAYFPKKIINLIEDALHNDKITHQIRSKNRMIYVFSSDPVKNEKINRQIKEKHGEIIRHYADLFQFADELYKNEEADFKLIDLRANRRLFDRTNIPIKDIIPYTISPDEL